MATALPSRPNLSQLRTRAKELVRLHRADDSSVCEVLRRLKKFASASDDQILQAKVSLQEAQHALAQEHGFDSWSAIREHIESQQDGAATERPDLVARLVEEAIVTGASDIHLDWTDGALRARLRVDGMLRDAATVIPRERETGTVNRFKVIASLDPDNTTAPQMGRAQVRHDGRTVDLRVSSVPFVEGESVVVRLLPDAQGIPGIDGIHLLADERKRLERWLRLPRGLIVCTGPTGSGKSTTAYALLKELNDGSRRIVTVEDPIEVRLAGVHQQQVDRANDVTFATAARALLHQDPDVLFIAEIRDFETLMACVQAALIGHLVITVMHASDSASTVTRLMDLGVEPALLADALVGVVAQRLVARVCRECGEPCEPDPAFARTLEHPETAQCRVGNGCEHCGQTGYRGRLALHELLEVDDAMREAIRQKRTTEELAAVAEKAGTVSLKECGRRRVFEGSTTYDQLRGLGW